MTVDTIPESFQLPTLFFPHAGSGTRRGPISTPNGPATFFRHRGLLSCMSIALGAERASVLVEASVSLALRLAAVIFDKQRTLGSPIGFLILSFGTEAEFHSLR